MLGRKHPHEAEVHTIGVDPAAQRGGIGGRLLSRVAELGAGGAPFLEVRTDNQPAITLYESVGFDRRSRRRYYHAERRRRLYDGAPEDRP